MSLSSVLNLQTATSCNESSSSSSPLNLPYLPDDLLFNCFARISRLYYPTLSLVSKRFRSLIASLELHKTRALLNRDESCLYVCLRFASGEPPRWFTLSLMRPTHLNPNPNLNPKSKWFTPSFFRLFMKKERKSSDNVLVSIPSPNLPNYRSRTFATIGSDIYMIGGCINGKPSSRVFFMDCRSHTWQEAPSMQTARKLPEVNVLDGKLYVVEASEDCDDDDYSILNEVFDPKTQTWEYVPSPPGEILGKYVTDSLVIKGNLYLLGEEFVGYYNPKENRWDALVDEMFVAIGGYEMFVAGILDSSCVIDEVTYCYNHCKGELEWYDYEERSWNVLKGLKGLPKSSWCIKSRLVVNYGGKIAVLWDENVGGIISKRKIMIWCAVIAIERRSKREIYGKVEWCDVVLTVPKPCRVENFVAAIV